MQPVMIVTGGSQGIGEAVGRLAAKRGYAVALTYQSNEAMARAVAAQDAQAARRAAARHVRIGQLALDGAARTDWMNG